MEEHGWKEGFEKPGIQEVLERLYDDSANEIVDTDNISEHSPDRQVDLQWAEIRRRQSRASIKRWSLEKDKSGSQLSLAALSFKTLPSPKQVTTTHAANPPTPPSKVFEVNGSGAKVQGHAPGVSNGSTGPTAIGLNHSKAASCPADSEAVEKLQAHIMRIEANQSSLQNEVQGLRASMDRQLALISEKLIQALDSRALESPLDLQASAPGSNVATPLVASTGGPRRRNSQRAQDRARSPNDLGRAAQSMEMHQPEVVSVQPVMTNPACCRAGQWMTSPNV